MMSVLLRLAFFGPIFWFVFSWMAETLAAPAYILLPTFGVVIGAFLYAMFH